MNGTTLAAGLVLALAASPAAADRIRPGDGSHGEITQLGGGLFELGLENLLIIKSNKTTFENPDSEQSTLAAIFIGGPTLRYFLVDNLSLAANLNAYLQHVSGEAVSGGKTSDFDSTEIGFLGTVMVEYSISLGRGMFFRPAVGGGGFYTHQRTPVEGNDKLEVVVTRSGGVGRAQLGFVYYTSRHFSLHANVDVLMQFGSVTRDLESTGTTVEGRQTLVDVGWNAGFMYVF